LVVIVFFYFGGFGLLDSWVRQWSQNTIIQNLLFFGVLAFASDILSLPVDIYSTFSLEERFGFNKTSFKTFVFDKLKGWLLALVIGGGILALIVFLYLGSGSNFWWMAWLVVTAFSLFVTMFYSEWIVPLFNKQSPLKEGELRDAIEHFAKEAQFRLNNIYTIDGSKRSTKSNAYFSGLGPKKRIVLYDTLINDLSVQEIVAVLAHEIGHYKKKHTLVGIILSTLQTGLLFFILSFFIKTGSPVANDLVQAVSGNSVTVQPSFYLGLVGFGLIYSPVSMLFGLFFNFISRKNEYQADAFAASFGKAKDLGNALLKLTVNNLSKVYPHPWYIFVYYSHPSLMQRLKQLEFTAD